MKAISIKQPYASLIAYGIKDIENRTWRTNFLGRVYIHASSKPSFNNLTMGLDHDQIDKVILRPDFPLDTRYEFYTRSAIIGEVDIVDCVINYPSIWAEHTEGVANNPNLYPNGVPAYRGWKGTVYNWVLANAVLYDEPILNVKGKLSFWDYGS